MGWNTAEKLDAQEVSLSRRRFLGASITGLMALAPAPALAGLTAGERRTLRLYNLHTGDKLHATYWAGGQWVEGACCQIDEVLRDHRSGEVHPIDRRLFDMIHVLHRQLAGSGPVHVISGYRSPATNASLRKVSSGVAKKSLHMQGMAMDIRIPGVRLSTLRDTAIKLRQGGVGYYPKSDFVHIDVGRVRNW